MAQAYTTKRGKNKKGKLGMRKDAANNAANKLSQAIFAANPLEFLSRESLAPKTLGNSATNRRRDALEAARASLNKLLTGACGNPECPNTDAANQGKSQLLLCVGCKSKAYCDVNCQKADWKNHKQTCKETAAKKAAEEEELKSGKKAEAASGPTAAAPLALTSVPETAAPAPAAAAARAEAEPTPAAAAPAAADADANASALD